MKMMIVFVFKSVSEKRSTKLIIQTELVISSKRAMTRSRLLLMKKEKERKRNHRGQG